MSILQIIEALLVLSFLVMFHELGHYLAGRLLGFTILEYAIGMGPKLVGFKRKGIEYNLRLLPIGGSCRFYGEDDGVKDERCFNAQKAWKRFIVILAGPMMNFVLAFLMAVGVVLGWGVADQVLVQAVNPGSPAEAAGMAAGDRFVSIDGKSIDSFEAVTSAVAAADSENMSVVVLREGEQVLLTLTGLYNPDRDGNFMDISISYGVRKASLAEAVSKGGQFCYEMGGLVFKSFAMLFSGEAGVKDLAGPVGVIQLLGQAATSGWYTLLNLCVMLSVNLGIVNLLPIPALDGGRILFILIEWVRGKPVPPQKEGIVHLVGFGLLILLVVVITFNDVLRLIGG